MFIGLTSWFRLLDKSLYFENDGDHADEMETSLIMKMRPELVLPLDEAGKGEENKSTISAIRKGQLWTERKWSQATVDTGIGNPKKATVEKGEKFFDDVTDELAAMFKEVCDVDMNQLYEKR